MKIQLLARNVPELEFRVYRVKDAEKFFAGLKDLHSFGEQSYSPSEQIDQRTWIERLHDFKAHLWWLVRRFFRGQFTDEARDSFRERQGKLGKKSRVVGATQFAQIPILNESQLVARWKLETPPAIVSETQQLPVDGLAAGVYLIEATDGTYKAYTVAHGDQHRAWWSGRENGQASLYVADRKTGAPVEKADVALWANGKQQSKGHDGRRRPGSAGDERARCGKRGGRQPENVWILARHGSDAALVTPWSYSFASSQRTARARLHLHGPARLPAGTHGAHQGGGARKKTTTRWYCRPRRRLRLK